jgi:6-pyruvoyltetrahydropterin/6-carboxytetrahydropterin synthase
MRISVFRKAHFNAAHRLHNDKWSDEKNKEVFGLCNNPLYHGHNYDLEVRLTGEINPETGFLYDLKILKDVIKEHVENHLDHKNLNLEVPEFKDLNPTAENICFVIYNILRSKIELEYEISVTLWETPRNFVRYPGE